MSLNTKDIVLVDGPEEIQFKTTLKIVLMSVPSGQMLNILHSAHKKDNVLVISPQKDARTTIDIMTSMLIASSEVIIQYLYQ